MEYIRKPSKISKPKTTTLLDGKITGEKGTVIPIDRITKVHYNKRFDGSSKLAIHDAQTKIVILSHTVENGKPVQKNDIVDQFLDEITSQAQQKYEFISGSNAWFYTGVFTAILGIAGTSLIIYALAVGKELPRKGLAFPACIVIGIMIALRGKAKKDIRNG